jgi:protein-tyrosine phosphatase
LITDAKRWIRGRYGNTQGFIQTQWHRVVYTLGHYNTYSRIQWNKVERLVFVCKGNICRSPFAEMVARSQGMNSISCGIDTQIGLPADDKAIEAATRRGEDLTLHETRSIASLAIQEGDLLVVMEPWQASALRHRYGNSIDCTLLGLWNYPVSPYIHDPYGSAMSYFDCCFEQIEKSVCRIKSELQKAKSN